ncbi:MULTISPECIES: caspase family protein [Nostocales]|uniref:Caspase family protein n=1 Tax=Dolichospermum flos-aquae UHCC 0037 TaxID=2590026 RepID=A0ACC7S090_DOLFA|nr:MULTISPECIES: caspase family protein [Nostocales]MBO1064538.1 caspase family protein [Anabaena sp. 54]MTJ41803.1 caspase family protein [Dolichospermum flos-aquae UHCC 0037]
MKRRRFLQQISGLLAALGLAETEWLSLGNPYYQALAQSHQRKLALLIGINQYPQSPALGGCLTDVELQTELLINRCGFAAADILTLTDEQASKDFIKAAFLDHLGKQAKSGDVVIFHFSGYGTCVNLGTGILANAIVPVDENNLLGTKSRNYLLIETLLLLLRSLPTNQVTAILDTSYNHAPKLKPNGLRVRTRPESSAAILQIQELEFLSQLKNRQLANYHPLIINATAAPNQQAGEFIFSNGTAGLLTYALTQYLWETTPAKTISVFLSGVATSMYQLGGKQQPSLLNESKKFQNALIIDYFPIDNLRSIGVIQSVEEDGKIFKLWLGGLPLHVLTNYGVNSRLILQTGAELTIKSRSGLVAKAQLTNREITNLPQVGQIVQESIRILPRNIFVNVALDEHLERIEVVDATSVFSGISRIANIITTQETADYVFGKVAQVPSRYGLFYLGGEPIINTIGEVGEAVKVAVQRLTPQFSTLLASKLWQLTENQGSSRLPVRATLEVVNSVVPRVFMVRDTLGTASQDKILQPPDYEGTAMPTIPLGSRLQYKVENLSDRPIYLILVGLNNNQNAFAFYPWEVFPETEIPPTKPQLIEILIPPGQTMKIPDNQSVSGWLLPTRYTFCEHQIILSTAPFQETLAALATTKYSTTDQQAISPVVNPLEVAQAILQDLHNASKVKTDMNITTNDAYILAVNNWASLNFSFQVV